MYLRDTLRLPAKGLGPSALPIFHQPARLRNGLVVVQRDRRSRGHLDDDLDIVWPAIEGVLKLVEWDTPRD